MELPEWIDRELDLGCAMLDITSPIQRTVDESSKPEDDDLRGGRECRPDLDRYFPSACV
jgi:hypothetical protein